MMRRRMMMKMCMSCERKPILQGRQTYFNLKNLVISND